MNCPLHDRETAAQLLGYCARKLDTESQAILERHIAVCPECLKFAESQRAVWEALEAWEAEPVSADFDRRLYRRIEEDGTWWDRLVRPLRPLVRHWNVAASAAGVFVLLAAGLLLNQRPAVPEAAKDTAQVEQVQPEQVEHALDAMDMLADFNRQVKASADAKM
ncbi:MAG TPA: hypothetical protein VMJ75_18635 [Candidatus Acidoferrales bacterium]|nr:hypothetical protein [Candidatus Acidoferrales bacterium]